MGTTESPDVSSPDGESITTFCFRPDQDAVVAQLRTEFNEAGIPAAFVDEIIESSFRAAAKAMKSDDFVDTDSVLDAAVDGVETSAVGVIDFRQVNLLARMLAAQVLDTMGLDVNAVQTANSLEPKDLTLADPDDAVTVRFVCRPTSVEPD